MASKPLPASLQDAQMMPNASHSQTGFPNPATANGALPHADNSHMPAVLVVDDDAEAVSHCRGMLDELGYRHHGVTSARQALEHLNRDQSIQILLADVHMPAMDGIALVEEARARIGSSRSIATILVAETVTADLAIKGMHLEAVDLLSKPFGFDAYSAALRRAMRYLGTRRPAADHGLPDMGQQLARLLSALEDKNGDLPVETVPVDGGMNATLRTIIAARGLRNRFFPGDLFADPAWDILLDLSRAALDKQQVSVSSVCIAASVPMSTALRWVRQMTEAGLLSRWTDPKDRRRDLIALTDKTADLMKEYLAAVHTIIKKI